MSELVRPRSWPPPHALALLADVRVPAAVVAGVFPLALAAVNGGYFPTSWGWGAVGFGWVAALAVRSVARLRGVELAFMSALAGLAARPWSRVALASAAAVAALGSGAQARAAGVAANPIQLENAKPGSIGWQLPVAATIEGYATEVSVAPGETFHLHVSTSPAERYRVEIYRLGWYGGLGARLVLCSPTCRSDEPGSAGPAPTPDSGTGEVALSWPITDAITVGSGWITGYYLADLVLTTGPDRGHGQMIPFVVRAPAPTSPILIQAAVNTWEAYNSWGGKSLYAFNSTSGIAATHVSFDRPYSMQGKDAPPLTWEYQLARFMEREGYDVSYTTDVDTDTNPAELTRHRLVIVSGHDEYWSPTIRNAFESARDAGVNLMFLGADIGDWQIRYEDARRTIVEYRDARADPSPDPSAKAIGFRQLVPARPPCSLLGVQYQGGLRSRYASPTDYGVAPGAVGDAWFNGTGFDSSVVLAGLVGYEWDGIQQGCLTPALTVLFHASGSANADAVRYRAPSGARVFSSGSLQFVWGLDGYGGSRDALVDPRLQRFMRNALSDMTGAPPPVGDPPSTTAAPQVLGRPAVGHISVSFAGSWQSSSAVTLAYQWTRCNPASGSCTGIVGATRSTYTPAAADVGQRLLVTVTASNSSGSRSVSSAPSGAPVRPSIRYATSGVSCSKAHPGESCRRR